MKTLKLGLLVLVVAGLAAPGYGWTLYTWTTNEEYADWHDPASWDEDGVPAEEDRVYIGGGRSAEISGPQDLLTFVWLGITSPGASLRVVEGADLNIGTFYVAKHAQYWANVSHNGGTVTADTLYLKYDTPSTSGSALATYDLAGGTLNVNSNAYLGLFGKAIFNQSGGVFNARSLHVGRFNDADQHGENTDVAYYNMTGGTIDASNGIYVGSGNSTNAGQGHVKMGNDAGQTGTITGDGFMIVNSGGSRTKGIVQGFGNVQLTGYLENNGMVIADGWGGENTSDRTLSMVNFSQVQTDESKQLAGAGWYAHNRGKLVLPTLEVASGSSAAFFGEDAAADQKLVNSMKLDFAGVNGGDVVVSLLAADHSEAGGVAGNVLGVWSIDGSEFDFGTGSVDLTIRYDDALSAELELVESDLRFYHKVNGEWVDITTGVDTSNKLITASDVDSFSLFAVGTEIVPEPATLGLIGIGGVMTLIRRRRK